MVDGASPALSSKMDNFFFEFPEIVQTARKQVIHLVVIDGSVPVHQHFPEALYFLQCVHHVLR